MPSWIKEKDGLRWFDERYTIKQTNQSPEQLEKKAKAGKIRRFKQRNGPYFYAEPDAEALREAYLKRKESAKKRKYSDTQLEARYARKLEKISGTYRKTGRGGVSAHAEKVMLAEIPINNAKQKDESKDS